jgi:hypothetical protein
MMADLLETIIEEFESVLEESGESLPRDLAFPDIPSLIQVAIGMRRTGKTYFLFQTIRGLLQEGITRGQILYVNFEDERLLPMTQKELGLLIDSFYSLYPENHDRLCYLFFDEIQNIEGWALVIRRLFDTKKVKIYLTGSSAKLLSKEIATSLRGRSISTEVWPYSFKEYCTAHHISPLEKPIGAKKLDIYRKHLMAYLACGGFPAVQSMQLNDRRTVLQSYVDSVVFRDIVERYGIKNPLLIKYLIKTLLKNTSSSFSIHKFYNDVKSQGYAVGKDTLYLYLTYIEDAFLTFSVPLFTDSPRKMESNLKKIYSVDSGLTNAYLLISENWGPLFENLIYLDLRREGRKIYYYKTESGYEIDFLVINPDNSKELFQVVWDVSSPMTLEREERALAQAEKELGIRGRLITPETYLRNFIGKS